MSICVGIVASLLRLFLQSTGHCGRWWDQVPVSGYSFEKTDLNSHWYMWTSHRQFKLHYPLSKSSYHPLGHPDFRKNSPHITLVTSSRSNSKSRSTSLPVNSQVPNLYHVIWCEPKGPSPLWSSTPNPWPLTNQSWEKHQTPKEQHSTKYVLGTLLKPAKVTRNKESLRACHGPDET